MLRAWVRTGYRYVFGADNVRVVFQNSADRDQLVRSRIVSSDRSVLIACSAVDLSRFTPAPEPDGEPVLMFCGRMLWSKGVGDLVNAAHRLRERGTRFQLLLVGPAESDHRDAVPLEQLERWHREGIASDFAATIEARGWRRVDALKWRDGARNLLHTFGDHCPDYTPLYTFAKFRLTGARCRHQRDTPVLRDLVGRLHANPHPAARGALVALAHGVFLQETNDQLHVFEPDAESELAERFFGATSALREHVPVVARAEGSADTFARFTSLGAELVIAGNSHGVVPLLDQLSGEATSSTPSLIALLGLCHGLFSPLTRQTNADSDYALLEGWLAAL
jgi:hypothetical protein